MNKGFGSKLSLLLTFFLFSSFLPAAAREVCPTDVSGKDVKIARSYYGSNGSDGRVGRDGRDGANQSVYADGSAVNLDLSGKDGEDGEDGEDGDRPSCGYHSDERGGRDIYLSSGGRGGDGGRGGNGGNGGSLLVYYTNLDDLKKILVRAVGGEGGRGGRGGTGAEGCRCRRKSWERRECSGKSGTPEHRCTEKTYRCHDGYRGGSGSDGKDGKQGKLGTLSIVKGKQPISQDTPTLQLALADIGSKQVNLSKNKWLLRRGATGILAIGSIMNDEYQEFSGRIEGNFQLLWQERQPITSFANQPVTLNLNDNQEIELDFPEDLWLAGNSNTQGNLTQFTVTNAIEKKDVTRLAVSDFSDAGENLSLKIVDLASKSDALNTKFRIKYKARDEFSGSFDYRTVYEGDIPSELVTRDYNRFILALGKLKIPRDALRPGVNVDMEIVATRSLGKRSAQQTLKWQGNVRKSR